MLKTFQGHFRQKSFQRGAIPAKSLQRAPFCSIKVAMAWAKVVMRERELADQPCFP